MKAIITTKTNTIFPVMKRHDTLNVIFDTSLGSFALHTFTRIQDKYGLVLSLIAVALAITNGLFSLISRLHTAPATLRKFYIAAIIAMILGTAFVIVTQI